MKQNKTKILFASLILLIGFFCVKTISHAQTTPTVSLGIGAGAIGSTVSIPLTVENNPAIKAGGIATLTVEIRYKADTFTTPSFTKLSPLTTPDLSLTFSSVVDPTDSAYMILKGVVADKNVDPETHPQIGVPNETIANVNFPINADATLGEYPLTLTVAGADKDLNIVTATVNSGSITLQDNHEKYGIANFVQLKNDWMQTKTSTADVNNDGIVNAKDLGIMMHYWNK